MKNLEATKKHFKNLKIDTWDEEIENIGARKWKRILDSLFDMGDYLIKYKNKLYVLEFIDMDGLEFILYNLDSYLSKYGIEKDDFLEDREVL